MEFVGVGRNSFESLILNKSLLLRNDMIKEDKNCKHNEHDPSRV